MSIGDRSFCDYDATHVPGISPHAQRRCQQNHHRNDQGARRVKFEVEDFRPIENTELKGRLIGDWIERNREWVKYVVPAYLLFFAVIAITGVVYGPGVLASANFYTSLLTLTLFLAILGLGQGAVILTGGLDLSVPWLITLSGVLLTGLTHGVNEAAAWAVPLVMKVPRPA